MFKARTKVDKKVIDNLDNGEDDGDSSTDSDDVSAFTDDNASAFTLLFEILMAMKLFFPSTRPMMRAVA